MADLFAGQRIIEAPETTDLGGLHDVARVWRQVAKAATADPSVSVRKLRFDLRELDDGMVRVRATMESTRDDTGKVSSEFVEVLPPRPSSRQYRNACQDLGLRLLSRQTPDTTYLTELEWARDAFRRVFAANQQG